MRKNDEARMTNDERSQNAPAFAALRRARQMTKERAESSCHHLSLSTGLIATDAQLVELLNKIDPAEGGAIDTEADSLHCYREKLCLVQISVAVPDVVGGIGDAGWATGGSH